MAGLNLDPWQQLVLRDSLGERPDGRWSAFEVGLVVARQNGKGSILEARELWGLFLGGERTIIHSAHKFDTAMEHLERIVALIEGSPELSRKVRKINRAHGKEGVTLMNGARLRFRARTRSGGARGYTGDLVVFDEAMDLPDEVVGAMMPVLAARSSLVPGPQIWYAGSAVDQETMANGLVLARVREAGIAGENERLAYFEWSAADDADPQDPVARAQANPGLGFRITPEYVETEFRSPGMSARQYAVERLGQGDWPDTSPDAGRVISREDFEAVYERDPSNRITGRPVFALDGNPDQTRAAIGVAGRRADGLAQFAVVEHARGTDWLLPRCLELKAQHPGCRFAIDIRGPLKDKVAQMKAAKLRVVELDTTEYAKACSGFVTSVTERRSRTSFPQPELEDALAGAAQANLGDGWKWSRRNSTSADISPLVAVTLALHVAETTRSGSRIINLNALED